MRCFILTMEQFPGVSKQEIDRCTVKQELITLANCVRSSLFTSYGLRKDVNLILCSPNAGKRSIRIEGRKLKYMGPDERSISMLLSKSINTLLESQEIRQVEASSLGISIVRNDLLFPIKGLEDFLVLYQSSTGTDIREMTLAEKTAYIFVINGKTSPRDAIDSLGNVKSLHGIDAGNPPDKAILLINNEIDRQLDLNQKSGVKKVTQAKVKPNNGNH